MKGVFEISGTSRYDDFITERYHFPNKRNYRLVADRLVRDWIVYRETRAAKGRMSYIAAAFVERIDPDPNDASHCYARVSQFLEFDNAVPYRDRAGRFAEQFLREMHSPADAGRSLRGGSIRELEPTDFAEIVRHGLASTMDVSNRVRLELDPLHADYETLALLDGATSLRRVESLLVNRKIRDANFRRHVLEAYQDTCAVTGMRIINGGGKAEAQAAHIWPVESGGPDVTQNGIALSATAHWLFDRHLISLDDDFRLLISHNKVPAEFVTLFPPAGERIHLPANPLLHPNRHYVRRHRERFGGTSSPS